MLENIKPIHTNHRYIILAKHREFRNIYFANNIEELQNIYKILNNIGDYVVAFSVDYETNKIKQIPLIKLEGIK